MVDEFSSFARMPQPEIKMENLSELCRQIVFQERNRAIGFKYEIQLPDSEVTVPCDARQVSRVLTNVLKNAAESIEGARDNEDKDVEGRITLTLHDEASENYVSVVISDDGLGLPAAQRDRLTEPYVTTREKGTGLGLAIVKKIMEEHGGALDLTDRSPRGANVILRFPKADTKITADIETTAETANSTSAS